MRVARRPSSSSCRRTAAACSHVRYVRNAQNLGPLANFCQVATMARGEYFMWAAHDDLWNTGFVSALASCLDRTPGAVLAAPRVEHVKTGDPAERVYHVTPAAEPQGLIGGLRAFYRHRAAAWIYGLYRTSWLQAHLHERVEQRSAGGSAYLFVGVVLQLLQQRSGRRLVGPLAEQRHRVGP